MRAKKKMKAQSDPLLNRCVDAYSSVHSHIRKTCLHADRQPDRLFAGFAWSNVLLPLRVRCSLVLSFALQDDCRSQGPQKSRGDEFRSKLQFWQIARSFLFYCKDDRQSQGLRASYSSACQCMWARFPRGRSSWGKDLSSGCWYSAGCGLCALIFWQFSCSATQRLRA